MDIHLTDAIAIAAAAASVYAAQSKAMIPLRAGAIAASLLAMGYGTLEGAPAITVLAALLLALNAWRLVAVLRLIRAMKAAAEGDVNADWLLPYTRPRAFKAGQTLMRRGEYATAAFYIVSGEVEIEEIQRTFGKGTLLGEIGLFTPNGLRTMTVTCRSDVKTAVIDYDQFMYMYLQNPEFGFRLLHLIVARLQIDRELVRPRALP